MASSWMSLGWWRLFSAWTSFTNSSCFVSSGDPDATQSINMFVTFDLDSDPTPQHPPAGASTLFERLDGHLPVLSRPVGLPHLAKVPLPQLLQQAELFPRTLPRLHVEEFPLHTQQGASNQLISQSISQSVTQSSNQPADNWVHQSADVNFRITDNCLKKERIGRKEVRRLRNKEVKKKKEQSRNKERHKEKESKKEEKRKTRNCV